MLNHENISFRIFEYHEGILDASQKAELMEYLHQNPELNQDFAIAAQARLHDEPIEKPVFAKKLLRKNPLYFYWPGISRLAFETITLCAIALLLNVKNIEKLEPQSLAARKSKTSNHVKSSEPAKTFILEPKKNVNKTNVLKRNNELATIHSITDQKINEDSLIEVLDLVHLQTLTTATKEVEIIEYEPTAKEPVRTIIKPEKKKSDIKRRYRKKYYPKQKFSLRPTSKIVPQSTGF